MRLTVLGCGNAFGTGGRLQTCFHVEAAGNTFLIDCGATALIGMERAGLDPAGVSTVLISHLHGDHFAGLVWWLLHAQYIQKRTAPLTLAGPPGLEERLTKAGEALYSGALVKPSDLGVRFVELMPGAGAQIDGLDVTAFEVVHPSGAPSYALRITRDGRTIAFSGDTEWTEALIDAGRHSDLFICECSTVDHPVPSHLNWITLRDKLGEIGARRVMLTHMSAAMFAMREEIEKQDLIFARDGLVLDI
ncbi:MAG: hypothetical protein RLZ98_2631 [Pseudomonadota bacterium]|jgi:ribonuclease BN (tRNA processing enzyme)